MLEKYYKYLYFLLGYTHRMIRRSKKKGMIILRFEGVIVCLLNDYENRRLLVFFYKTDIKQIYRTSFHGYYVRPIRKKIVNMVTKIQEDPNYWEDKLTKRRSYNYKQERAFKYIKTQQFKKR